nr:MAG TPA: hypothetical protein [Caudoviricetes sp.]
MRKESARSAQIFKKPLTYTRNACIIKTVKDTSIQQNGGTKL